MQYRSSLPEASGSKLLSGANVPIEVGLASLRLVDLNLYSGSECSSGWTSSLPEASGSKLLLVIWWCARKSSLASLRLVDLNQEWTRYCTLHKRLASLRLVDLNSYCLCSCFGRSGLVSLRLVDLNLFIRFPIILWKNTISFCLTVMQDYYRLKNIVFFNSFCLSALLFICAL